jgi:ribosomal protein S27E
MLGYQGPAQRSPALGDALNAGTRYLEVRCLGCDTHQTVALDIVRRPKTTPSHELEQYIRCKGCSQVRLFLQAQPSRRSAADQDFGQQSGVDVVAG